MYYDYFDSRITKAISCWTISSRLSLQTFLRFNVIRDKFSQVMVCFSQVTFTPLNTMHFVYHLYNDGPTSKTLGRRCINVIQMLCVYWGKCHLCKKHTITYIYTTGTLLIIKGCFILCWGKVICHLTYLQNSWGNITADRSLKSEHNVILFNTLDFINPLTAKIFNLNSYPLELYLADAIHNFKWVKIIQIWQNAGQLFSNPAGWCRILPLTYLKMWYLMCYKKWKPEYMRHRRLKG